MRMRCNNCLAIAAAGALSLALAPWASATAELRLSDGTTTLTIVDGSAQDSCAVVNCVTYNGTIGAWNINVSTGIATFGASPSLDLNTVNLTSTTGAPQLTIEATASGYSPAASQATFSAGGTVSAGGTYTFQGFGGLSNGLFDESNPVSPLHTIIAGATSVPFSFNDFTPFSPVSANLYSMTIKSTLVFPRTSGIGSSDTELDTAPVPEPAAVTLLGGVLLCTVGAIRRRSRQA